MAYAYASKEEEEKYTRWLKDLRQKEFQAGEESGIRRIIRSGIAGTKQEATKKLASIGIDTDTIVNVTGLTFKDVQDILRENA